MEGVNDENLTIMQWNSRSIKNKFEEFVDAVSTTYPHIVAIQESHLKNKDKLPNIQNYNIHRKDRPGDRGGGLILFVRKDIKYYFKKLKIMCPST